MTDHRSYYSGKTILVVGAGRTGIAAVRFLLGCGARVVLTDIKDEDSLASGLSMVREIAGRSGELVLELGGHRTETFARCSLVVVSPGVPLSLPPLDTSREAGVPVWAEIELAYRHLSGKILAITGSNGKTTTTTLVSELLRGAGLKGHAAGNVGIPLISFAEASAPDDIYAVELSSFQLEGIDKFRPHVGSILNLAPDHLDRYSGFEAYVAAKRRVFMNQETNDFAVLNGDDIRTASMASEVASKPVLFSRRATTDAGAFIRNGRAVYRNGHGERELFQLSDVALKGGHNLENVLAACCIAILAGAASESLKEVVRSFRGIEHRIEFVAESNGVQYFNDSKATNIDATVKSLEAFPGNILLIAGGRDKGGDFTVLRPLVRQRVKHLVLIGEAAGKVREALSGAAETSEARSMHEAVTLCRRLAQPGDVVLLAPACASFDMFRDYEDRGRVFKQTVREQLR